MRKINTRGLVYVQGPAFYSGTCRVFKDAGYDIVNTIEKSDIVVLTGGGDISPSWYNQKPIPGVYWDDRRDKVDYNAITEGHRLGKFMVGICRGAQFLNVTINKGSMFQDVDGHTSGYHPVYDHIADKWLPEIITVHHQQCVLGPDAVLIASANESTCRRGQNIINTDQEFLDPEVIWYPGTKSLLFQGHPEFGHQPSTDYFLELMGRYYEPTRN